MTRVDPIDLSQQLMRCASVTPLEADSLSVLEAALIPLGFSCRRYTFAAEGTEPVDNLFATWASSPEVMSPHFAFAGHVDVVPVGDAAAWTRDPFSAQIENGILYGRGAADMKTGIAAFVAAASRLMSDAPPQGRISLLITCDEEGVSINGTKPLLEQLTQEGIKFDACVVGEPCSAEFFGDTVKIGRRGSITAKITFLGKQGHVAYPNRADNPVRRALTTLQALQTWQIDTGMEHFQPSNLEVVGIDVGNSASNVIPAKVSAMLNIRFNPLHTSDDLKARIKDFCDQHGGRYTLTFLPANEPFLTKPSGLSAAMVKAIQHVAGVTPELSTTGGTSDARFIARYCPVVEFGVLNQTSHQVDEHVAVADVHKLADVFTHLLSDWFAAHV